MKSNLERTDASRPAAAVPGDEFQVILHGFGAALARPLAALRADLEQKAQAVTVADQREQVETLLSLCDELQHLIQSGQAMSPAH